MKYLHLLLLLSLVSCQCPPPLPNGTKQPCQYVGPNITGSVGFHGVSVGVTLWGKTLKPEDEPKLLTVPDSVAGIPVGTK